MDAQTWRLRQAATGITVEDATLGVSRARRRPGTLIHEPALRGTSAIDKSFLVVMTNDDGPSKMANIQQPLHDDVNYAREHQLHLIAAELIHSTGHGYGYGYGYGYVDFAVPHLREILAQARRRRQLG